MSRLRGGFRWRGGVQSFGNAAQKFGYRCATVRSVAEVLSDFDHADVVFASWMSALLRREVVLQFVHRCAKTIFNMSWLFFQLVDGEWQL